MLSKNGTFKAYLRDGVYEIFLKDTLVAVYNHRSDTGLFKDIYMKRSRLRELAEFLETLNEKK